MKFLVFFFFSLIYCAEKAEVFFTKTITSERIVDMFKKLNVKLTGNVGLKIHSGEPGGLYFLKPDFLQKIYDYTKGTFLECNTAYKSDRSNTTTHKEVLKGNGWYDNDRKIDIMDENPEEDIQFNLSDYNMINITFAGSHLLNYDSCLVLSHFKGHGSGGFGGALKQLSIGFASQKGKTWIHTAGKFTDWTKMSENKANQENFTNAMGDAASEIVKYFKGKGGIVYINVLANISLRCDCAGIRAPPPKIKDIGILASTDPVAIDQACFDLIKKSSDEGTEEFLKQVETLQGENTIKAAEKLGVGTSQYTLIDIDGKNNSGSNISISINLVLLLILLFCNY